MSNWKIERDECGDEIHVLDFGNGSRAELSLDHQDRWAWHNYSPLGYGWVNTFNSLKTAKKAVELYELSGG